MRTQHESILTIIVCAAMLESCATLFGGTTQEMTFQSSPEDVLVTVSYSNLLEDIDKGGGEDFNSLMSLLHIEKDQQADALRKIEELSEDYRDAPTFADFVIAHYLK